MKRLFLLILIAGLLIPLSCKPENASEAKDPDGKPGMENIYREEKSKKDSLNNIQWEQEEQERREYFFHSPLITKEEIATIQPVIQKWLGFYQIDLPEARLVKQDTVCFTVPDPAGPYYLEYTAKQNSASLLEMIYSPDKQRYIDLGIRYKTVKGKNYQDYDAYDDSQQVYLTDRKLMLNKLVANFGMSGGADAAFWKNNHLAVITGVCYDNAYNSFFIHLIDLKNQTRKYYNILMDEPPQSSYKNEVILKEKRIITNYAEPVK